eukprot:3402128-Pyramimonas_sp.AAC.1
MWYTTSGAFGRAPPTLGGAPCGRCHWDLRWSSLRDHEAWNVGPGSEAFVGAFCRATKRVVGVAHPAH